MSQPGTTVEPAWVTERRDVGVGFARFYAAFAVAAVVVSALDLFEDFSFQSGSITVNRRYGSVWWMAAVDRGGVAGLGSALLLTLVLLLVVAGLRPVIRAGIPFAITVLSAVLGLLVVLRAGIRPPHPELAAGGQATIALTIMLVVVAGSHTVRLFFGLVPTADDRVTPPPAGPPGDAGTPPR